MDERKRNKLLDKIFENHPSMNKYSLAIKELKRIPKMLGFCKIGECVECDVHREIIRRRILFLQTKLNKE